MSAKETWGTRVELVLAMGQPVMAFLEGELEVPRNRSSFIFGMHRGWAEITRGAEFFRMVLETPAGKE